MRHVPVARITAFLAIVVGVLVVSRGSGGPHWRTIGPGVEFTTVRGEPYCRMGSAAVGVLRMDPARARLRVRHFSREGEGAPLTATDWLRRTGALAVFNAGQYYADYSYMGLLVSGGREISSRRHPGFKAALVGRAAPAPDARVLDLELEGFGRDSTRWSEVAQSFMLFDRGGQLRVRRSELVANRTAVAEDRHGRILAITSEGGYTLWEFATFLKESRLELTHAMAMDGGREAALAVRSGGFHYLNLGRWDPRSRDRDPPGLVPLPAVVTVTAP